MEILGQLVGWAGAGAGVTVYLLWGLEIGNLVFRGHLVLGTWKIRIWDCGPGIRVWSSSRRRRRRRWWCPPPSSLFRLFASIFFFVFFRAIALVLLVHLFAFLAVAAARLLEAVYSFHRQSWSLVSGRTRLVMLFLPSLFPSLPSPPFPSPVSIRKREQDFIFFGHQSLFGILWSVKAL